MYKGFEKLESTPMEGVRGGQGSMVFQHIFHDNDFLSSISHLILVTIPPGSSVGFHEHSVDEEVYFVLEGQGKVRYDDLEYIVGPFDTVLTTSGHRHGIENTGDRDLKLLAIIASVIEP